MEGYGSDVQRGRGVERDRCGASTWPGGRGLKCGSARLLGVELLQMVIRQTRLCSALCAEEESTHHRNLVTYGDPRSILTGHVNLWLKVCVVTTVWICGRYDCPQHSCGCVITFRLPFFRLKSMSLALQFRESLGGEEKINAYCRSIALAGGKRLAGNIGHTRDGPVA